MKKDTIDKEIESLSEELEQYSGSDPRHGVVMTEIERLEKLKNPPKERPWWKPEASTVNTIITSACSIAQLLLVISFETNGMFRSRALSWVTKPRV